MIPFQFLLQSSIVLKFFLVYEMKKQEREQATREITDMLSRGELMHNVAHTYLLDDVVAAHEAVESGRTAGNVVLRIA
jgi:NADPH2:quinone reductase